MATLLNTNIRGEQVAHATISGVHVLNYSLAPIKVDVYNVPIDGDVLTYKDATSQFEWNSIGTMVVNEIPTGSINGANTTFVLNDTPVGNTLKVNLNGILQQPGVGSDYTTSGTGLTFVAAPEINDVILCSYLMSAGLGGGVYTDHGNLDGLGDDDHSQYILANGNRSFTGVVAGVTPTLAAHLATMGYVDTEIGSHTHDASDVISSTFADARIAQTNVTQHEAAINHNNLLNKHNLTTDINHNALTNYVIGEHRTINDAASGATDLWSAEKIEGRVVTATGSLTTDHGALTGLSDDDHTQYFLADGSRELSGDLLPEMTGASGVVSVRDIGSVTKKFQNLYVHDAYIDSGSLYVNNKKVLEDVSDVMTISTDTGQRLKLNTLGGAGDVYIEGEGGIQFSIPSTYSNKDITISNESSSGDINIGGSGQSVKLTGTVNISNATVSHSNLSDLSSDDHSQYSLVAGTRAFTNTVGGVTPTSDAHLTTKGYVDSLIQGLDWQESVLDRCTVSGASETVGYRYISSETGGTWVIHHIYEWNGSSWNDTSPTEGFAAWVEDEDVLYTYNGSSWVKFGSTVSHNNTSGLQGGTSSEYYHLTSAQHTDLTDGGDSSSHKHDDKYYTETEIDNFDFLLTSEMTTISGDIAGQIITDHGALTGLEDDDHTQYLLIDGTREGTGDLTISGSLVLYNNKSYYAKTTGGTIRRVAYLSNSDQIIFGDTAIGQNYYRAADDHVFQTWTGGVATKLLISQAVGIQLYDDVVISAGNNLTLSSGTVTIGSAGTLEAGQDSPTGSGVLGYNGNFYATKVYNAVYNDIADFQKVLDEIEYGKCYYDTADGAKLCTERCQMAVIGIASDTFGFGVGNHTDESYAPFAIAGWVLAHVDQEYPTGTPLTNNEEGVLTEILSAEKREFPERIVATYKKKETAELWGPNDEIKVNGRSWVKVK